MSWVLENQSKICKTLSPTTERNSMTKKDKIIQITDTLDQGDGDTYGLSESGNLYKLKAVYREAATTYLNKGKVFDHYEWEYVLGSPRK